MELTVANLQRKFVIDVGEIRAFVDECRKSVSDADGRQFAVAFVSDRRMMELNEMFRGKKATTDVLSFPYEADEFDPNKDNLGDIVISAEQAARQAEENGLTLDGEIRQLILHGVLHLCGYDHEIDEGEMNAKELELREKLGI